MKEFKLSLNEEQFKALQKLLYLGKWMLESHHDDSQERFKIENEVEQAVFAISDKSIAVFSDELNMYFPTLEFEDEMQMLVNDYDQYTFWDELINQLADRDLQAELGDTYEKIDFMERMSMLDKYTLFYSNEFMQNDLDNLIIR
ncbi:MAG TPA: hypothetical protein PK006_12580 [Saprospiraceae bacterium]|nr:hypothetical protein [Saprospiraceae bacterium]